MKASPEITSFWRFALLFALFIAALGLLPHLLFSLNSGGLHYMNGAWDEDAYTGYALRHDTTMIYRMLGSWVFRGAIGLLGLDGGLISMDGIAPFITAIIAAGICYRIGFRTRASMFIASCLLLFALEFLALNSLIMVGPLSQLMPDSSLFYPDGIRMFIPNVYENFFNLYKSPEPQITFILQFAALYLLLRHAQTLRVRYALLLGVLSFSFPYIYVSVGISLILCMGLYAVAGLLTGKRACWLMLATALMASAYYVHCIFSGVAQDSDGLVFTSRLPLISISMLWGGGLVWLYLKHWGQNLYTRAWLRESPAPVLLALACCAVPCIALNQQLLTGRMVQGRAWEGYGNFPFIALALLVLWPLVELHVGPRVPQWLKRREPYAATGLAMLLVLSQLANFAKYTRANMDDLITAQLLNEQKATHPKGLPNVILEASGEDAQVALRMGNPQMLFISGFQQTFDHPIALLSQGDDMYMKSQAAEREEGFTYFDRLGVTQDVFAQNIERESTKAMGKVEVARFFSYMDCWKPLSDSRNMNIPGMKEKIPSIIADYGSFLKDKSRRNQFGELWLATRKPHVMRDDAPWKESVLATKTLGMLMPTTVTIYQMTPR